MAIHANEIIGHTYCNRTVTLLFNYGNLEVKTGYIFSLIISNISSGLALPTKDIILFSYAAMKTSAQNFELRYYALKSDILCVDSSYKT